MEQALVKAKRNGELVERRDDPLRAFSDQRKDPHLRDYWQVLVKRRWTVLTCFLVTVVTVATATFVQQPIYKATATIKIEKAEPKVLKFEGVAPPVDGQTDDYYQTQYKLLTSYSLAERVVRSLRLDSHPEVSGNENPLSRAWGWLLNLTGSISSQSPTGQVAGETPTAESPTIKSFLRKLEIEPVKNTRLVKISFLSSSPDLSAQVSNALAEGFIEHSIEQKLGATKYAGNFLEKQIHEVRAKLESSDELLHKFARQKQYMVLDEKQEQTTKQLSLLTDALMKARSDRLAKEALHRQTQGQGQDFQSIPSVLESLLIAELKKEYFRLQAEYGKLSETFLPDYPRMVVLKKNIEEVKVKLEGEVERVVKGLQSSYEAALKSERLLDASVQKQKQVTLKTNEDSIQYNILKREVDINRELYAGLLQRMKEITVSAGLDSTNIQVTDRAKIPMVPYRPQKALNILLGVILGLSMGVGLAFFSEYLDNTLNTVEEVEGAFGLPILGVVPALAYADRRKRLKGATNGEGDHTFQLIMYQDQTSLLSEAIRNIRTSLLFSLPENPPKLLLMTSPQPGEGKTGVSINTAIALSQLGGDILLIDADMRHPDCHRILEQERTPGLSNFLVGEVGLARVVRATAIPNLHLMPAGQFPLNPAELLGSERMKVALDLLRQQFRHVVIDSPPVLGFTDSVILSTIADAVVLIVRGGKTTREAALRTIRTLNGVNAKILGVVINSLDLQGNGYPYYSDYLDYYRRKSENRESTSRTGLTLGKRTRA